MIYVTNGTITVQFTSLDGNFEPSGMTIELLNRAGFDGDKVRWLGKRGQATRWVATQDTINAAIASMELTRLKALQGHIVTLVDRFGDNHAVLLEDVIPMQRMPITTVVGGLNDNSTILSVWQLVTRQVNG